VVEIKNLTALEQAGNAMFKAYWERPEYRETIRQASIGERKYIRFFAGRGHFAHLRLQLLPCPGEICQVTRDADLPIPQPCYEAARISILNKLEVGPIHGYPMLGMETRLIGATFLPGYSHEEAFARAASMAFDDALPGASPFVVERWSGVTLKVDPIALSETFETLVRLLDEVPASVSMKQHFVLRTQAPVRLLEEIRQTFGLRGLETYPLPKEQQFRAMTDLPPKRASLNSPLDDWT
jgi:translation elongation factor EF-G